MCLRNKIARTTWAQLFVYTQSTELSSSSSTDATEHRCRRHCIDNGISRKSFSAHSKPAAVLVAFTLYPHQLHSTVRATFHRPPCIGRMAEPNIKRREALQFCDGETWMHKYFSANNPCFNRHKWNLSLCRSGRRVHRIHQTNENEWVTSHAEHTRSCFSFLFRVMCCARVYHRTHTQIRE